MKTKPRKKPLRYVKSYQFIGFGFNAATPLRAMAQWTKRNPEALVVGVNVNYGEEGDVAVSLSVEMEP